MIYRLQLLGLSLFLSCQFRVQCISNDWTTHVWKDGRTYYFNHKTGITQWETPSELSIETNPTSVNVSVPAVTEPSDHRRRPMRSSLSHYHTTINGTTTANKTLGTNRIIEHKNTSTIHETEKYDNFVNGNTSRTIDSQKNILQKSEDKSLLNNNATIHDQRRNDSVSERYSPTSNLQTINEQKITEMENMETNSSKSSRKVELDMQSKFDILLKKYRVVTNHLTKSEKSRHKLMKKLKEISRNRHHSRSSGTDDSSSVSYSKSIKENKYIKHGVSEYDETMEGSDTNESIIQEKIETHPYGSVVDKDNSSTTVWKFSDTIEAQSLQREQETIIELNGDLKNRNTEVDEDNISIISHTSINTDTRKNSERENDSISNIQLQNRLQMQENELIEAYAEIETMKLDLKNIASSSLKKLKQKSFFGRLFDIFRNKRSRYSPSQVFKNRKREDRLSNSLINESEDNNIDIVTAYKNELKEKGKKIAIDTTLASYSDIEKKYNWLVKNHTKALEELQLKNDLIESLKLQHDKSRKLIETTNDIDEDNESKNIKRTKENETTSDEDETDSEEESEDNDNENDILTDKPVDILNDNDTYDKQISETDVIRGASTSFNNELTKYILVDNIVTVTESDVQELMHIIEDSESAIGRIENQTNNLLVRIRFLEEMPQLLHRLYNYLDFIRRDYNTYELNLRHTVWVAIIQQMLSCYNLTLKDCETKQTLLIDENSDLKKRICDTELLMNSALSNQDKLNSELSECRKKLVNLEERLKFNNTTNSMIGSNSGLLSPSTSSPNSQQSVSSMSQQSAEPPVIPLLLPHPSSGSRHIHQRVGSHVKHALVKIIRSILKILSFGKL